MMSGMAECIHLPTLRFNWRTESTHG